MLPVLRYELRLELHDRIFDACARQILNFPLGYGRSGVSSTIIGMMAALHIERNRVVSLTSVVVVVVVVRGVIVIGLLLAEGTLPNLTATFRLRVGSDQASLDVLLLV